LGLYPGSGMSLDRCGTGATAAQLAADSALYSSYCPSNWIFTCGANPANAGSGWWNSEPDIGKRKNADKTIMLMDESHPYDGVGLWYYASAHGGNNYGVEGGTWAMGFSAMVDGHAGKWQWNQLAGACTWLPGDSDPYSDYVGYQGANLK